MDVLDRGGVLLRFGKALLGFIPAGVALRLTALSSIANVPGLAPPAIGIALVEGVVVTVLTLQPSDAVERASSVDHEVLPGSGPCPRADDGAVGPRWCGPEGAVLGALRKALDPLRALLTELAERRATSGDARRDGPRQSRERRPGPSAGS